MAFTDTQLRQLKAKLDPEHIKTRHSCGATLYYLEGWHVIAEANRVFGFDGWDRETISTICVASGKSRGDHLVAYTAKVRITVRAGDSLIVREGSGTGEAKGYTLGQAHELALKSAETDATKRALASFGNRFGLALYDPDHAGVKHGGIGKPSSGIPTGGPYPVRSATGEILSELKTEQEFAGALRQRMSQAANVDDLFGFWQQNVEAVRALHGLHRRNPVQGLDGTALVAHLKACARRLFEPDRGDADAGLAAPSGSASRNLPAKIDKSVLTISEPKRIRSKEHLRFVAQQPCLICGRKPSHAHHIRFAQPRGLALKVSDEFTVPLCAIHHHENHTTGNEKAWWQQHKIEPVEIAEDLWRQSREKVTPQPSG
jgi:DNA recombination protein Rad52